MLPGFGALQSSGLLKCPLSHVLQPPRLQLKLACSLTHFQMLSVNQYFQIVGSYGNPLSHVIPSPKEWMAGEPIPSVHNVRAGSGKKTAFQRLGCSDTHNKDPQAERFTMGPKGSCPYPRKAEALQDVMGTSLSSYGQPKFVQKSTRKQPDGMRRPG